MIKIRQAKLADIPEIVKMSRRFYETTTYPGFAPMDDETVARLAGTLAADHVLLVAEETRVLGSPGGIELVGTYLVGMIGLFVAPWMFNVHRLTAHEVVWWVDPSHLGAGLGRTLIEEATAACKARGAVAVQMVHLSTSPPQAAALYQKLGFIHSESSYTLTTEG